MQLGWIKLHRSLLDWEWYDDTNTFRLFLHLLLKANHAPTKWRGITIERGQHWTSLDTLSAQTSLSKQAVRTSLTRLKSTCELTDKPHATGTLRGRMITIVNYDQYQAANTQPNTLANTLLTPEQHSNNIQSTPNKNDKNENNENNDKNKDLSKPLAVDDLPSEIFEFWKSVFNKSDRNKFTPARKNKVQARLKDSTVEEIKSAITGCAKTPHNMGQNDTGTVYDDLTLICRNRDNIERYSQNNNAVIPNEKIKYRNSHQRLEDAFRERDAKQLAEQQQHGSLVAIDGQPVCSEMDGSAGRSEGLANGFTWD